MGFELCNPDDEKLVRHADALVIGVSLVIDNHSNWPAGTRWSIGFGLQGGYAIYLLARNRSLAGNRVMFMSTFTRPEPTLVDKLLPHNPGFTLKHVIDLCVRLGRLGYQDPQGTGSQWWIHTFIMDLVGEGYLKLDPVSATLGEHWNKAYCLDEFDGRLLSIPATFTKGYLPQ
ncbi:hypothetical protein FQN50_005814 [Emmonsiellopsis sp. PD_5]|nr:hypothetical protein FQN50_005814 [Emmonsiellopsis sp. PD_5]